MKGRQVARTHSGDGKVFAAYLHSVISAFGSRPEYGIRCVWLRALSLDVVRRMASSEIGAHASANACSGCTPGCKVSATERN